MCPIKSRDGGANFEIFVYESIDSSLVELNVGFTEIPPAKPVPVRVTVFALDTPAGPYIGIIFPLKSKYNGGICDLNSVGSICCRLGVKPVVCVSLNTFIPGLSCPAKLNSSTSYGPILIYSVGSICCLPIVKPVA